MNRIPDLESQTFHETLEFVEIAPVNVVLIYELSRVGNTLRYTDMIKAFEVIHQIFLWI
jgi:hypothetical protein